MATPLWGLQRPFDGALSRLRPSLLVSGFLSADYNIGRALVIAYGHVVAHQNRAAPKSVAAKDAKDAK
jgi:hypothetical protein